MTDIDALRAFVAAVVREAVHDDIEAALTQLGEDDELLEQDPDDERPRS